MSADKPVVSEIPLHREEDDKSNELVEWKSNTPLPGAVQGSSLIIATLPSRQSLQESYHQKMEKQARVHKRVVLVCLLT